VLEGGAILLIIVPIFIPTVQALGIDPVHFGVVVVVNSMIGLVTPPYGLLLFVVQNITKAPLSSIIRDLMPFLYALIAALAIITFIPRSRPLPAAAAGLPGLTLVSRKGAPVSGKRHARKQGPEARGANLKDRDTLWPAGGRLRRRFIPESPTPEQVRRGWPPPSRSRATSATGRRPDRCRPRRRTPDIRPMRKTGRIPRFGDALPPAEVVDLP
jgi:hypothetical protein